MMKSQMEREHLHMSSVWNDYIHSLSLMRKEESSAGSFRCSCRTGKAPAQQKQKQKHLYLVLDDWEKGYGIYRVGEDELVSDAEQLDHPRQAESPLVRIKAHHCAWYLAGHGTKIFVMNPADSSPGIPVFDTATSSMTVCPNTYTRGDLGQRALYASVGDRLLSFVYPFIDMVGPEPSSLSEETWSVTSMEHWLPFNSRSVRGYAVHPDGRTVFMSVEGYNPDLGSTFSYHLYRNRCCTYALDTERLDWTYLGEWILPFAGQGHYDSELDAWVGICLYREREQAGGRVCCCDVPSAVEPRDTVPVSKICVDALFQPGEPHFGTKLLYMGDSKFCLVESRRRVQPMPMDDHDDGFHLQHRSVKMTSFVLKYDKVGDLQTTRRRAYASMWYQSHKGGHPAEDPVAFWM
ncbi:hypothetical protein PR202_gb14471 [Eleusine coracana subsp. coracana]|uniref:DUF1618 domain-containing protein n=1 Tax=Eleusine coracana subsp. coracana TaxID=191504 RepID=A0AAV5ET19_ELECO|nr:hypothetical protein QOZ80_4BG0335870 [Eleusine coracana subsp. coracana]GJN26534.1 hypothetical protein PR202_gb14471 [Eleusine coracana subsp. coracana]